MPDTTKSRSASGLHVVVLAGGVGGARFLRGLRGALAADAADAADAGNAADAADAADAAEPSITVIGNTGDDITLFGLRVCPDLDTVMYTLGGGIHEDQGWGRADETFAVKDELMAYGA
jgi:LPPG:FO 2-phospho-L-lactate transferase